MSSDHRRVPVQKRSRQKYDRLLASTKELVGLRGVDAVSMREIARHAEVPVASAYQYFPDKSALLAAVLEGYFSGIRELIELSLGSSTDLDSLESSLLVGIDAFYALFRSEPALANLWTAIQADPALRAADAADTERNANLIASPLKEFVSEVDDEEVEVAVLLLLHTAGMVMRLALSVDDRAADRMVDELKRVALLRLRSLTR